MMNGQTPFNNHSEGQRCRAIPAKGEPTICQIALMFNILVDHVWKLRRRDVDPLPRELEAILDWARHGRMAVDDYVLALVRAQMQERAVKENSVRVVARRLCLAITLVRRLMALDVNRMPPDVDQALDWFRGNRHIAAEMLRADRERRTRKALPEQVVTETNTMTQQQQRCETQLELLRRMTDDELLSAAAVRPETRLARMLAKRKTLQRQIYRLRVAPPLPWERRVYPDDATVATQRARHMREDEEVLDRLTKQIREERALVMGL